MMLLYTLFYVCLCMCMLSRVQLFVTPSTVACQDPLSMGFSRQEYWSRLPFPPRGDLPNQGLKPRSPASPALAEGSLPLALNGKSNIYIYIYIYMYVYMCIYIYKIV